MRGRRNHGSEGQNGPVWPPQGGSAPGDVMPVRVTRQVHEVVEALGTPAQLAESGLTAPGGHWTAQEYPDNEAAKAAHANEAAGALPAAGGEGLMAGLIQLARAAYWLAVQAMHNAGVAVANHPHLALWASGGLVLWQVTS